jgi:hypothetical protein
LSRSRLGNADGQIDDTYRCRVRLWRSFAGIEIVHQDVASIKLLLAQRTHQEFGSDSVGPRTEPDTEQDRAGGYNHRSLPSPKQLFAVLTQDEAWVLVVKEGETPLA